MLLNNIDKRQQLIMITPINEYFKVMERLVAGLPVYKDRQWPVVTCPKVSECNKRFLNFNVGTWQ